ncbi:MAG: VOC family protein [Stenotrophomonas maltophilia]
MGLKAKDIEAAFKFYTDMLGFEISVQRSTATFLTCREIHHDLAL